MSQKIFGELSRVIALNLWPPCSPDLTFHDLYLFGDLIFHNLEICIQYMNNKYIFNFIYLCNDCKRPQVVCFFCYKDSVELLQFTKDGVTLINLNQSMVIILAYACSMYEICITCWSVKNNLGRSPYPLIFFYTIRIGLHREKCTYSCPVFVQ